MPVQASLPLVHVRRRGRPGGIADGHARMGTGYDALRFGGADTASPSPATSCVWSHLRTVRGSTVERSPRYTHLWHEMSSSEHVDRLMELRFIGFGGGCALPPIGVSRCLETASRPSASVPTVAAGSPQQPLLRINFSDGPRLRMPPRCVEGSIINLCAASVDRSPAEEDSARLSSGREISLQQCGCRVGLTIPPAERPC